MTYCYTYYSFDGRYIPSSFFMKMARLSVASLKSVTHEKVMLFTDKESVDYFVGMFDEVVLCDYSLLGINPRYWNFAKMMTYTQMTQSFFHVDFDTMFMPGFSVPVADIVTEKIRDYSYSWRIGRHGYKHLERPTSLICSGLIGCRSYKALRLFTNNAEHALEQCKNRLLIGDNERVSIEEYAFSQLVEQTDLCVKELDRRYFAHWQGNNKQERYGTIINKLYNQIF